MKEANIKWVEGFQFVGKADSGHAIVMDGGKEIGGSDSAVRPGELTLIALGGCTGIDVVNILNKMRVNLDSFEVQVRAEAVDEEPKVWKEIWIKYIVHGEVPEEKLKKAIDLSYTTYCSVGAMLKKTAKVNYEYGIIDGS